MGRRACCTKEGVNRGAWTAKEDSILVSYIKAHGEGKWREVPQRAGLRRCGKSCRLRWLNYLRPNIKRGNISDDEEELIIRLHNLLGNRWSLIAGRLPGRTDNEIKNYWNSTLGKKAGRPRAAGDTRSNARDANGGAADADVANSNAGAETASVWAPKAVRCSGGFLFGREILPPPIAGELQTAGGGLDGDDCSADISAPPSSSSSSFPLAEPSFSGGDWMDDVRALASFLESDDWLTCQMTEPSVP